MPPLGGFFMENPMTDFSTALMRLWPQGDAKIQGLRAGMIAAAPVVFARYGLTTPLLVAHVAAQWSHECGAGLEMVENIHYTAERACQVWPSRFHSAADCYAKVGSFAGDLAFPVKLIDSVYGGRMGNRLGTHDGSTFIGRGLSQVTGREGYEKLGARVGLDLVNHPELIIAPEHALECGVTDFILCGCLPFAKADDVVGVTRRLNGGTVGLAERVQWLSKWKAALADTSVVLAPIAGPAPSTAPANPTGPRVAPPAAPKPVITPKPLAPSFTHPAKGSIGAAVASIFAALLNRKG
jgi:putative chitinase